jgi:tetratricopeptide (TPR) repeat protein
VSGKIAKDFIEDARKKCRQENYQEAIQDCLQAIEINPLYSKAHRQHGMALYLSGNLDAAEVAWEKAWQCDCKR